MVKFELEISCSSLTCLSVDETSTALLQAKPGSLLSSLLADDEETNDLKRQVQQLVRDSVDNVNAFETFTLVFKAPGAPTESTGIDRSPIHGVFRSPIRAIHLSNETELSCMVHIQMSPCHPDSFILSAMELSRKYREKLLRQEFGSWLLEDHIESSVIATDPMGTVVFWNRFASELYQYTSQEAIGQSIMALTPSEMTQEMGAEIFGKLLKGEHWKGFFGVQRKDKSRFMAHVTDTPVLDQEGNLKFVVGVSADYSQVHNLMDELKNLNANLEKEVEARTRALLDRETSLRMVGAAVQQSDTGCIITDETWRIVWSNDAAQKLLRLSSEQIEALLPWNLPLDFRPGMGWDKNGNESDSDRDHDHDDDDDRRRRQRATRAIDSKGADLQGKVRTFFQGGSNQASMHAFADFPIDPCTDSKSRLFLSISVQAMTESKNRMIVIRDLTADRDANAAHRRADREAAASKTKTEMIQMLSHEFRTPLQGIMGVVSTVLLDLKEDDSGLHECLSTIAASSRLLLTLINNVLDLGKMDANKMEAIELSPTSVHSSIQDALVFCEPFARMNECKLKVKDDAQVLPNAMVIANKLRLEQVLINLLSNAVKYSGVGTEVFISVRQLSNQDAVSEALSAGASDLKFCSIEEVKKSMSLQGSVIVVTIEDQGRGIPETEMSKLFGEFNQLAISKEKDRSNKRRDASAIGQSSGSGLGLSLVLKFVSMMNGHIWVTNADEGGARFHFCFPIANSSTPTMDEESNTVVRRVNTPTSLSPALDREKTGELRVLLLDDSLINLKVLKRMLARLGVHQIQIFQEGEEALQALGRAKFSTLPQLILTDLAMPTMSGYDFLDRLTESGIYKTNPPVIACSADWTSETEQRCLHTGFSGYLRKPIVLSVLSDLLVNHMNYKPPQPLETSGVNLVLVQNNYSYVLKEKDIDSDESKVKLLGAPNLIEPDLSMDQVFFPILGFNTPA